MAELPTTQATGKRKSSVARVRLVAGTGAITVNGRPIDEYFNRESQRILVREVFEAASVTDRYDIVAYCKGGGSSGQS